MSHSVEQFIRNVAVPPVVRVVLMGNALDCRICVTADKGHDWPTWVTVQTSQVDDGSGNKVDGLFASTNDMDFMVGYPPSYYDSKPLERAEEMIESIVRFLTDKLNAAGATRCEVRLLPTQKSGGMRLPNMEGNSDSGLLKEQVELPSL
jgi:hypothetical protein